MLFFQLWVGLHLYIFIEITISTPLSFLNHDFISNVESEGLIAAKTLSIPRRSNGFDIASLQPRSFLQPRPIFHDSLSTSSKRFLWKRNKIKNAFNKVKKAFQKGFEGFKNIVKKVGGKMMKVVGTVMKKLDSKGGRIIQGILTAVTAVASIATGGAAAPALALMTAGRTALTQVGQTVGKVVLKETGKNVAEKELKKDQVEDKEKNKANKNQEPEKKEQKA